VTTIGPQEMYSQVAFKLKTTKPGILKHRILQPNICLWAAS
jgi:hypothetical protein